MLKRHRTWNVWEEIILYADDVAVFVDSITDIQKVANRWWFGINANGMTVNTTKGKTDFVVVPGIPELHDIYMDIKSVRELLPFRCEYCGRELVGN